MSGGPRWKFGPEFPEHLAFIEDEIQGMAPGDERIIERDGEAWIARLTAGFIDAVGSLAITYLGEVEEDVEDAQQ